MEMESISQKGGSAAISTQTIDKSSASWDNFMTVQIAARVVDSSLLSFRNMSSVRGGIDRESDSKMAFDTSDSVKVMPTFDSLNLKEDLLRGIYAYGKFWWCWWDMAGVAYFSHFRL